MDRLSETSRAIAAPSRSGIGLVTAVVMTAAAALVFADKITGWHGYVLPALVLYLIGVATGWAQIKWTSRIMTACCIGTTMVFALGGGTLDAFMTAASRAIFLPALLTVMTILQVAAQRSEPIGLVARYVVDQPPGRRFAMLTAAGQVFGIILNLAGYRFLLGIAIDQCRQITADPEIRLVQERRILGATLCGFGATIMWSPVGIALNLILPLIPDMDWIDYAPYGISAMLAFVSLRYFFDRAEAKPRAAPEPRSRGGVFGAIAKLGALLVGITGGSALAERLMGISMQGALLMFIPLAAVLWSLSESRSGPMANLARLGRDTFLAMPRPINEICLLLSTGFVGLLLVELFPPMIVRDVISALSLSPAGLCAVIVVLIAGFSMIAISPMITGTLCVGAVLAAGVDIPPPMLVLATLTGWSFGMILSPVTGTQVVTAAIMERPARQVGLQWNGLFVLTYTVLMLLVFAVWGEFL